MKTLLVAGVAAGLLGPVQDEKLELRYRFAAGDRFPLKIRQSLSVKLDQVPEALQGILTADPVDLKIEARLDMEVKEAPGEGPARLEGRWRRFAAKGRLLVQDVDYVYDAEGAGKARAPEAAPGGEPLQGLLQLEERLEKLVREPLRLSVDRLGKVRLEGASGRRMEEIQTVFLSLHGLMGALPEARVARGDSWKGEVDLGVPGLAGAVGFKIRSENTYAEDGAVGDVPCAVIRSKYTVAEGERGERGVEIPVKTAGDGEGKVYFRVKDGRPARAESRLNVRLEVTAPDPGGGDPFEIKGTIRIDQVQELS
ncbi:MAG: hypothetical protein ACK44W_00290 [Planctomycetota bacterium]